MLDVCWYVYNVNYVNFVNNVYTNFVKGTLMQIWKSTNIFVFI